MSRREFAAWLAAVSASAALPLGRARAEFRSDTRGFATDVVLAGIPRGSEEEGLVQSIREAAEAATDFAWLSKGDRVLIKPVLNSGNPYPMTSSPVGIRTMAALLKERGAGRVIVSDMSGVEHVKLTPDGLRGSSRELMVRSGMAQAAEAAGAELYFPEEEGWGAFFEDGPASGSNWKAGIMMPRIAREVDHIVLMPRCGRHVLAGCSLGMKAAVGYWRTDTRLEYHQQASTFHEKTAEANTVSTLLQKQRLVLTVATKLLTTFGPDRGFVSEPPVGLVIASRSIVAHDMISLAWLLENRRLTPDSEKKVFKDPYLSQAIVGNANRIVVKWLGGLGAATKTQKLVRNDIRTIWDDRVLKRAYELWKGVPEVRLVTANEDVPAALKGKLEAMTSRKAD